MMLFGSEVWEYITYFILARQSNILSQASDILGRHTLLVSYILLVHGVLKVSLRSTKTNSSNAPPVVYELAAVATHICVLDTW